MIEASNANSYEQYQQQLQAIRLANQPILDNFENWLYRSTLSEKTINDYMDNIRFFTNVLYHKDLARWPVRVSIPLSLPVRSIHTNTQGQLSYQSTLAAANHPTELL